MTVTPTGPKATERDPPGGRALARRLLAACLAAMASGFTPALAGVQPRARCPIFPINNVWNTDVSSLPVHAKSEVWLATMEADTSDLHPDFGAPPYGLPFAIVREEHPDVFIDFLYDDQSDPGPYPFGPDIPLENGSDAHALMIDRDACVLYELFAANWNHGDPRAGSGAIFDLDSNALRPDDWTSADAAGLAIFPGLVRYDEVLAGAIRHAIRFTTELTDCHHIWPARHDAGTCDPSYPPMGARFRLKAGFSLAGFTPQAKVILRAMKRYGLLLADNGSNWYFQGTRDPRWSDDLLDQLKSVPASAFEAIDESGCIVDPDSAEADCP